MEYRESLKNLSDASLRAMAQGTLTFLQKTIRDNKQTIEDLNVKVLEINVNLEEIREELDDDEENCAVMESLKFCKRRFVEIIVEKQLINVKLASDCENLRAALAK